MLRMGIIVRVVVVVLLLLPAPTVVITRIKSNDIPEVLCSGEPTAGKLLMHFFLFYGQIFEVCCIPPPFFILP